MEYDLILEQGQGFAVWNRAVTDRMGVRVVWPERMPDRNEMVVFFFDPDPCAEAQDGLC